MEAASPELIEKTGIASQKERDTEQPKSLMSQASSRNDGVVKALNGFSKIAIDVQMLKLADSPDGKWLKDLVVRNLWQLRYSSDLTFHTAACKERIDAERMSCGLESLKRGTRFVAGEMPALLGI